MEIKLEDLDKIKNTLKKYPFFPEMEIKRERVKEPLICKQGDGIQFNELDEVFVFTVVRICVEDVWYNVHCQQQYRGMPGFDHTPVIQDHIRNCYKTMLLHHPDIEKFKMADGSVVCSKSNDQRTEYERMLDLETGEYPIVRKMFEQKLETMGLRYIKVPVIVPGYPDAQEIIFGEASLDDRLLTYSGIRLQTMEKNQIWEYAYSVLNKNYQQK